MYEVAWTRLLTLQMGHTVAAVSTVLAGFMGGLAIGAWIAGRFEGVAPSSRLRAYAALEVGVALAALALPILLAAWVPPLRWAYADGSAPLRFGAARLAISLTLVGVPAVAMGATFPLAAAWFSLSAADTGALYAANTGGAAIGALIAGFWSIPAIGLRGTTLAGVALNAVAAGGALWLARGGTKETKATAEAAELINRKSKSKSLRAQRTPRLLSSSPQPALACTAAAISGFAALVYEVAWTRLIALVIGPTTYAFATMAASFIIGLAIGSAAGTRLVRRSTAPATWLAAMLIVVAVSASVAAWFTASRLPLIVAAQVADPQAAFGSVVLRQAFIVALLLLPMTSALGVAFPLALAVASAGPETVGRDTARVYAANTLGAIAGALAGGFVLLPWMGLQGTFRAAAIVGLIAGSIVWTIGTPKNIARSPERLALRAIAVTLAAVVAFALPAWDRELLASGAYKYAPYMQAGDLETALRAGRLEYYKEGSAATVSVRRLAGTLSLSIDGKVDASNAGDMLTQRLLGLLPVLMHPQPRDICIIGLGSGVTAAAAVATVTVDRTDIVEISPEVVEASRFFAEENDHVLQARGVHLIVGDGRSHLLLATRKYDVIVSEPSNPWMAGVAALFTREFFEAARSRLKDEGVICQWAHTYDITSLDLRSIVRTFRSVFPQSTMWLVGAGDLLLIGTNGGTVEAHLNTMAGRESFGPVAAQLTIPPPPDFPDDVAAPSFSLMSLYAGGPDELERFGDATSIQIDDRMALEFSAPRGIYGRAPGGNDENAAAVRALVDEARRPAAVSAAFARADAVSWTARGVMNLKAEAYAVAYDDFRRAVTLNSRDAAALRGLSQAAGGAGKQQDERAWLQSLAVNDPGNAEVRIELSRVLASIGELEAAIGAATEAVRMLGPADPHAAEQLASVYADAGDAGRLAPLADILVAKFPGRPESHYYRATALFLQGRAAEAADEARRLVAENPRHSRGQSLLGAACATLGQRDCALAAFQASLRANPHDPATYVNLGVFRIQTGDPAGAADAFAEALTLDPLSASARGGLSQARALVNKP